MTKSVVYDFLYFDSLDLAGDPDNWGIWTGPDNVTIDMISGTTFGVVSRSFVGGGTLLKVPQIIDSIGIDARNKADFEVSQINTYTRDHVFGAKLRGARVTLNRGRRNPATNAWLADPEVLFVGRVDTVNGQIGSAGGQGSIIISCRPDTIDLNEINPAMKDDESTQEMFGGDRIRRYDVAQLVTRKWGQVKGTGKSTAK